MMADNWGYFMQGSDQMLEVEELGAKLSKQIECGVHYPAFGKKLYECNCNIIFPFYVVKGEDWDEIRKLHKGVQS